MLSIKGMTMHYQHHIAHCMAIGARPLSYVQFLTIVNTLEEKCAAI